MIPGFGDSSLDFTLTCHVATFVDQYPVQHELRKRILRRLRAERIDMPFPTRTIELREAGELREARQARDAGDRPPAGTRPDAGRSGETVALADRDQDRERDHHERG